MASRILATLLEQLFGGVAEAVADVREKVVEEPWFGRAVTERDETVPRWMQTHEDHEIERAEKERERGWGLDDGLDR